MSPKVEDNQVFEWLLEYVLVVLKWYGVESRHVKGENTTDGCVCGVFRTQYTVPWLNTWTHNWIEEKQQIPKAGVH